MIAGYVWLAAAWIFVLAVMFKRWREREARDAARTQTRLDQAEQNTDHTREMDARTRWVENHRSTAEDA